MNPQELLRKADLALADLTTGGLLNVEQSNRFFRKIIDQPTILQQTRRVLMRKPTMEINKIGFMSRLLQAAKSSSTDNSGPFAIGSRAPVRSKPTTEKITLNSHEMIAEVDIPYEVLEDNIEGGQIDNTQFENTILDLMAERVALDLEEWLINADKSSGDDFLALEDGLLKRTTSNIVNQNSAPIDPDVFANALRALPTQYHRFLGQYKFWLHTTKEIDYRMQVAQRQTSLGDATLQGTAPVSILGVAMQAASELPTSTMLLTIPRNILWGIHRDIRIEFDRDIRERTIFMVVTLRAGIQIEEEDMIVKITNVG